MWASTSRWAQYSAAGTPVVWRFVGPGGGTPVVPARRRISEDPCCTFGSHFLKVPFVGTVSCPAEHRAYLVASGAPDAVVDGHRQKTKTIPFGLSVPQVYAAGHSLPSNALQRPLAQRRKDAHVLVETLFHSWTSVRRSRWPDHPRNHMSGCCLGSRGCKY
ncbi:hypothetical protein NHX12_030254 [Muraenolepis orangiensis]|uniref:Uncharacterized protein n=1 Tax=Muraenolepis orangiensis TaxID=630683 RepID=A0A9Q0ILI9_9TELE|nr:hypothetical protein NHX12_030254 [Muraenolepis orangiensis]